MCPHLLLLNRPRRYASTILLCLIAGGAFAAPDLAQTDGPRPVSVEELKVAYLNCNREAVAGRLDHGTIQGCSVVYEALKEKAFGGEFARLLAWSRAQEVASERLLRTDADRR